MERHDIFQDDMVEVFTPYIVKNGKIIYPKNKKYFHFWVKRK